MMAGLDEYRRKRNVGRTPEPIPADDAALPRGNDDTFVIQEHHARRLHWDVRLERGGVLVCWAVPRGLPAEPGIVRLAVHTEDHPLEYARFSGEIPHGEYGGGRMFIWDRGTYETVKWSKNEVSVVFHGERVDGKYVFFKGGKGGKSGRDWMVRRSDPPQDSDWETLPGQLTAMKPTRGKLPPDAAEWAYGFRWNGLRALARVEGGRLELFDDGGEPLDGFPDVRALGEEMGSTEVWLDGELVVLRNGKPDRKALDRRKAETDERRSRLLAKDLPVTYVVYDVLHFDGRSCLDLPYEERRELLAELPLRGGWQAAPSFPGAADAVVDAAKEQGLPGVVAKRLDSTYQPGKRTKDWLEIARP